MFLRLQLLLFFSMFICQDSSTIYVSLEDPWIVACSAQNPANITWRLTSGGQLKLNVTQVTNRKSVLYVRLSAATTRLALLREPLQCRARDLTTMQETLIDQFEFMIGSKPSLLMQSPSVNQILLGQSIRLVCAIPPGIYPHPSVMWIFQSNGSQSELRHSSEDKNVKSRREVSLDVSGKKSNGTYFCNISNSFGYVLSSPIVVIVAYLNKLTISINPSSRRVIEKNDVTVSAHVDCNPVPFNITLSQDGDLKANMNDERNLKHNFKAEKSNTGSYVIRAVHVLGQVLEEFFLLVLSLPSAVKFSIQNVARSSVSYNWTVGSDGNADVKRVVLCCGKNVDDVKTYPCSGSATVSQDADSLSSANTLFGLRSNATSYCELFVSNEVGVTASGVPKIVATKVPSRPKITSCISEEETVIALEWKNFNEGNPIIQYVILYQSTGIVDIWKNQTLRLTDGIEQTGGRIQLTQLKKLTFYQIRIVAESSVGRSQMSSDQCWTTCDLPAPLESKNDTRATLEGGEALQLYVDDRCGNATELVFKSCDSEEKPLETKFSVVSSRTFWANVTFLESGDHCVMIKATTFNGIRISSNYVTFRITAKHATKDEENVLVTVVAPVVAVVLTSAILIAVVVVCRYQRRNAGSRTKSKNEPTRKVEDQKGKEHYKRGPLYEEVELSAARNDQEVDMQDSRAYGVVPVRNTDILVPNLHDSPAYAHIQATPSH